MLFESPSKSGLWIRDVLSSSSSRFLFPVFSFQKLKLRLTPHLFQSFRSLSKLASFLSHWMSSQGNVTSHKETWLHLPRPGSQTQEADRRSGENAGTHFRHRHIHGLQRRLRGAEEGRQPSRAVSGGPPALEQAAGDLSNHIVSCQIPADAAVRVVPRHRRHKLSRAAPRPTFQPETVWEPELPNAHLRPGSHATRHSPFHRTSLFPPFGLPFHGHAHPKASYTPAVAVARARTARSGHFRSRATPLPLQAEWEPETAALWGRASGSLLDLFRFERSSPWSEGVFGSPATWSINNHQPGGERDFRPSGRNTRSKPPESLTMGERGLPRTAVTGMSAT